MTDSHPASGIDLERLSDRAHGFVQRGWNKVACADAEETVALLDLMEELEKGTPAMIEAIVDFFDRRGDLIEYEVAEQALNIALKRRL